MFATTNYIQVTRHFKAKEPIITEFWVFQQLLYLEHYSAVFRTVVLGCYTGC